MSWLVDNANIVYLLLGSIALGFIVAGWLTRRVKFFALALIPLTLIGLFWLLTRVVVTDQQQIHNSVDAMAMAVVNQDADTLFKHVSKDFQHHGRNRQEMHDGVARAIKMHKVKEAFISNFQATDVSRTKGTAKASFRVRVDDQAGETVFFARCEAAFVLEADQWKLNGIEFFNAVANQDQPMNIPLP
jgi:uncharacterized membrane protein (Fun14 family)